MCYNIDSESFCYYSDNKNIPYKYLETVARLYVIQNKCRILYTHMPDELNSAKKRLITEIEMQKKILHSEEKDDCVFVQFKSYNLINNSKNMNKNNKNMLVKIKANRYSHRGTLQDYTDMTDKLKVQYSETSSHIDIDFATFKKKHI
jgi:hypothetical protein